MGEQELQKPVELSSGSDMLSEVVANPKLSRGELLGVKRDNYSLDDIVVDQSFFV